MYKQLHNQIKEETKSSSPRKSLAHLVYMGQVIIYFATSTAIALP